VPAPPELDGQRAEERHVRRVRQINPDAHQDRRRTREDGR
jgi:hypothetical protein